MYYWVLCKKILVTKAEINPALTLKKFPGIEFVFSTKNSSLFQAVNAETVREVCTKYIYDKSPAIAAVGKPGSFFLHRKLAKYFPSSHL